MSVPYLHERLHHCLNMDTIVLGPIAVHSGVTRPLIVWRVVEALFNKQTSFLVPRDAAQGQGRCSQ